MIYKRYAVGIIIRVVFLFATIFIAAFLLTNKRYVYELFVAPVIILQLIDFYRLHKKSQEEVELFAEALQYRDFSANFNVNKAPGDLKTLRKSFNDINSTFRLINKEKETQFQYLQKILELIDTGILSYNTENGEIVWMNEALKKLLQIPYLKNMQSLEKRDAHLFSEIANIKAGENMIGTIGSNSNPVKVLISGTVFQTEEHTYKLLVFQNINEALEETESNAWKKLLSVMTHEIMNSVAPISSLADTLNNMLKQSEPTNHSDISEDLELGITTIKKRSESLLRFAETYRSLNKINKINASKIFVRELFENVYRLMLPTFEQKHIDVEIILKEPAIFIHADPSLIEQVLINLLVNAIDAVKNIAHPQIILSAGIANNKTIIRVSDNGAGMSPEVIDKIFVPFFSTKKTGSGIGLSLCKQIIMLHKGAIQAQSKEGEGSVFTLVF
jgi:nitrogen fixation/metabolism regulation signal transduction histidine kinase